MATDALPSKQPDTRAFNISVVDGPDSGLALSQVGGQIFVGCAAECELRLSDRTVSGKHLTVGVSNGEIRVSDLGSTNGTYHLGARIDHVAVTAGASLTVGNTELLITPASAKEGRTVQRYGPVVGESAPMQAIYETLRLLEGTDHPVLLIGETGVGKSLVARAIHESSARSGRPFEVLDCGALSQNLAESEIFGHLRGAFTGATADRKGAFERADHGTVFIDEVESLPRELQTKLLRALEDRVIRPLGSNTEIPVRARVLAAAHPTISEKVERGDFRSDLYYRLNVVPVTIPPLRERRSDIPTLAHHLLGGLGASRRALGPGISELLTSPYDWPGNVRELRNMLSRVISLGYIELPSDSPAPAPGEDMDLDEPLIDAKKRMLERFERGYVVRQLERAGGNKSKAAALSKMDPSYFRRLLERHGIE
ncbi:MAG: sigma 54-dependent Fis family transcriptional regulator [Myxococcota bacterium]